jgi:predicted AlkP superfamily phosphohydrolase/phosphomutase
MASLGIACEKPHVLVVGLDGANWTVLDPLIDAGHLPNIGRLVRDGARGSLWCAPANPTFACFCPPVWTSIATGVPSQQHRVNSIYTPSSERRVKAIWNVLDERGGITTSVSYRATWPPEPGMDFVFTEPGLDAAGEELFEAWGLLEHPGRDEPDTLFQPPGILEALGVLPGSGERPPSWAIYGRDRAAMESMLQLAAARMDEDPWERETELTMMIIHGPDKVAHVSWGLFQPAMYGPFDDALLVAGAAGWTGPVLEPGPFGFGSMASPYLEVDEWLGRLLAIRAYDYVVFVSDHGMTKNQGPGLSGAHNRAAIEGHYGIFSIHGPGIRSDAWLGTVSVLDVTPTLAYLLDLPVALDLPGRVLSEALTAEQRERRPAYGKTVPTWE